MCTRQQTKNDAVVQFMERRTHQSIIQEYRNNIHSHISSLELNLEQKPVAQPLQPNLWIARDGILNSIFDVVERLHWSFTTFSLAVNLLDTFTSQEEIVESDYKFHGYCCLWISSKYNENKPKGKLIDALIKRAGYDLSRKKDFLNLEFKILTTLKWDLSFPTADSFLDMFITIHQPNHIERKIGSLYLCELSQFNQEVCFNYSASSIATASILLTNIAIKNPNGIDCLDHEFNALESSLLKSVLESHISIEVKYFSKSPLSSPSHSPSHSSLTPTHKIIGNLINLANSLLRKQQEMDTLFNRYTNQMLANYSNPSVSDFVIYSSAGLPISPIASPTNLHHQHHHHNGIINNNSNSISHNTVSNTNSNSLQHQIASNRHSRSQSITALRSLHIDTSTRLPPNSNSSYGATVLPTPGTTPITSTMSSVSSCSSSASSSSSATAYYSYNVAPCSGNFSTSSNSMLLLPPFYVGGVGGSSAVQNVTPIQIAADKGGIIQNNSNNYSSSSNSDDYDDGKCLKKRRFN
ncbi:hypothetical protein CANARDRAFT_9975 [[Candida] arabinofermentans NRRL YB-2248]|uniref:Cyclin-like domain-containing protein n=1 Tax=[Candida] arabinofermentans NRRL YB-2248 TaxID=983967 RepID=A0A1E4SU44_9ASCO|nr:hypothetical protein CANARDRAFT_9975 [[Candida] arabinofermentans NRRL YB-2248]